MHRHIGSTISEALDMYRPLQGPPRSLPPHVTSASIRAGACHWTDIKVRAVYPKLRGNDPDGSWWYCQ